MKKTICFLIFLCFVFSSLSFSSFALSDSSFLLSSSDPPSYVFSFYSAPSGTYRLDNYPGFRVVWPSDLVPSSLVLSSCYTSDYELEVQFDSSFYFYIDDLPSFTSGYIAVANYYDSTFTILAHNGSWSSLASDSVFSSHQHLVRVSTSSSYAPDVPQLLTYVAFYPSSSPSPPSPPSSTTPSFSSTQWTSGQRQTLSGSLTSTKFSNSSVFKSFTPPDLGTWYSYGSTAFDVGDNFNVNKANPSDTFTLIQSFSVPLSEGYYSFSGTTPSHPALNASGKYNYLSNTGDLIEDFPFFKQQDFSQTYTFGSGQLYAPSLQQFSRNPEGYYYVPRDGAYMFAYVWTVTVNLPTRFESVTFTSQPPDALSIYATPYTQETVEIPGTDIPSISPTLPSDTSKDVQTLVDSLTYVLQQVYNRQVSDNSPGSMFMIGPDGSLLPAVKTSDTGLLYLNKSLAANLSMFCYYLGYQLDELSQDLKPPSKSDVASALAESLVPTNQLLQQISGGLQYFANGSLGYLENISKFASSNLNLNDSVMENGVRAKAYYESAIADLDEIVSAIGTISSELSSIDSSLKTVASYSTANNTALRAIQHSADNIDITASNVLLQIAKELENQQTLSDKLDLILKALGSSPSGGSSQFEQFVDDYLNKYDSDISSTEQILSQPGITDDFSDAINGFNGSGDWDDSDAGSAADVIDSDGQAWGLWSQDTIDAFNGEDTDWWDKVDERVSAWDS